MERGGDSCAVAESILIRETLPGDADDYQSRYIEAAVNGILISSIYPLNGNPQPGPEFTYNLDWFDRLIDHAAGLLHENVPAALAGNFDAMPIATCADEALRDTRDATRISSVVVAAYPKGSHLVP